MINKTLAIIKQFSIIDKIDSIIIALNINNEIFIKHIIIKNKKKCLCILKNRLKSKLKPRLKFYYLTKYSLIF